VGNIKMYLRTVSRSTLGMLECTIGKIRMYLRIIRGCTLPYANVKAWRVAANTLNKQSRTADKGWSSSLGVGRGANNSSP
jgi:hypothetical protein